MHHVSMLYSIDTYINKYIIASKAYIYHVSTLHLIDIDCIYTKIVSTKVHMKYIENHVRNIHRG